MRFPTRKIAGCVAAWWVGVLMLCGAVSARAYTAKDVETLSSAFTSAFYSLSQNTNGYFKNTQTGGITYAQDAQGTYYRLQNNAWVRMDAAR